MKSTLLKLYPAGLKCVVFFFSLEVYKGEKDPEKEDAEFLNWTLFVNETYLLHKDKKSRQVKQNTHLNLSDSYSIMGFAQLRIRLVMEANRNWVDRSLI